MPSNGFITHPCNVTYHNDKKYEQNKLKNNE